MCAGGQSPKVKAMHQKQTCNQTDKRCEILLLNPILLTPKQARVELRVILFLTQARAQSRD